MQALGFLTNPLPREGSEKDAVKIACNVNGCQYKRKERSAGFSRQINAPFSNLDSRGGNRAEAGRACFVLSCM